MASLNFRIEPLLTGLADDPRMPKGAEEDIRKVISESPLLSRVIANASDPTTPVAAMHPRPGPPET